MNALKSYALALAEEYAQNSGQVLPTLPDDPHQLWTLIGSLNAVRVPAEPGEELLALEEAAFAEYEAQLPSLASLADATAAEGEYAGMYLWRGDITRLRVDGIVNAANSRLLGCFVPQHRCIDNAIHRAAGVGLRAECAREVAQRPMPEPTGSVMVTDAHRLPSRYVLHTVGPIITGELTDADRQALASCYRSCLRAAIAQGMRSVALCCISTGEFRFPQDEAARCAVETVREELDAARAAHQMVPAVVFNVFTERDEQLYTELLGLS
ncbi:macro domain-containing protein [Rothia mucilaginosa]|uniref:macro domain-containing protein n=1 Tax=Rothia mucilaginosa TaxID=43675 RepID=UPI00069D3FA1|nr:macro domain-containing protein [Rothia mucilaginosa]